VGRHLETARRPLGAACVDGQDDALGAEAARRLVQQLGPGDRRRVEGDLVGAGPQQPIDVVDAAHSPADRQRDEHLLRRTPDDVVCRVPAVAGRGDVQEDQLVRALGVVDLGHLDRVAGVAQVAEVHALDDPAGVDVEARDHPDRDGHPPTPGR
jgi:hypothetical protein